MSTLNQQEKEDLRNVFGSISDVKPSRFSALNRFKLVIYSQMTSRLFSLSKKRFSYQK